MQLVVLLLLLLVTTHHIRGHWKITVCPWSLHRVKSNLTAVSDASINDNNRCAKRNENRLSLRHLDLDYKSRVAILNSWITIFQGQSSDYGNVEKYQRTSHKMCVFVYKLSWASEFWTLEQEWRRGIKFIVFLLEPLVPPLWNQLCNAHQRRRGKNLNMFMYINM